MKSRKDIWLLILALVLMAAPVCGGIDSDAGTSALAVLKVGLGARAQGMGCAYTAVSDDVNGIYHNPAGLSQLSNMEVSFQHLLYIESINYANVSVASPSDFGVIGLSFSHVWMDSIDGRESLTDDIREFDASDSVGTLSYSRKFDKLGAGVSLKLISSKIDDASATGFAADIGLLYSCGGLDAAELYGEESGGCCALSGLKAGLVVQNLGGEVTYDGDDAGEEGDPLPMNVKLGLSYPVSGALVALDVNMPSDNRVNANVGCEYQLSAGKVIVPLRLGYSTLNDFDVIDGLSAGFGVVHGRINADFAWTPFGELGDTFRTSLVFKF
jgi:hypothetical protein